jgi:hypothetical protein
MIQCEVIDAKAQNQYKEASFALPPAPSIEIKKMMFRIESQRDGQTLAPDAIRGTSKEMIQAPAGRQNHSFKTIICRPAVAGNSFDALPRAYTQG